MKTFKQFISEEEVKELVDILKRDCKPFLNEANGLFLRRGVRVLKESELEEAMLNGHTIELYTKQTRRDRKALSTSSHWHELADEWFAGKFGLPARTQAVFCLGESGNYDTLKSYGIPCMIFPIGEFSFVWSPKVADLFSDIDDLPHNIAQAQFNGGKDESRALFFRWMDKKGYEDGNLSQALSGSNEIMMVCNSYYAVQLAGNKQALETMMRDLA